MILGRFRTMRQAVLWALKEGFVVGRVRCQVCGSRWLAFCPPEANVRRLECSSCGSGDSAFWRLYQVPKSGF